MKRISILLTQKQMDLLHDFFAHNEKSTGMIIGQFFEAKEGPGYFEVAYFNQPLAEKLQEVVGVEPGRLSPKFSEVYIDVE